MEALCNQQTELVNNSHSTSLPDNMLNKREYIGGVKGVHKEGNVVKSFNIGNTRVKICDDYCRDKTPFDVQAILKRIAQRAQMQLSAHAVSHKND